MKTSRFLTIVAITLLYALPMIANAQKAEPLVIDTIHLKNGTYELGITSLEALNINMKKDGYTDLVRSIIKSGWILCPSDSVSLRRIALKVPLETEVHKFNAFIATVPFRSQESTENAFKIPEVYSRSGDTDRGVYFTNVGYFFPEEPSVVIFYPIKYALIPGYWRIGETPVMYDWVIMRKVDQPKL